MYVSYIIDLAGLHMVAARRLLASVKGGAAGSGEDRGDVDGGYIISIIITIIMFLLLLLSCNLVVWG